MNEEKEESRMINVPLTDTDWGKFGISIATVSATKGNTITKGTLVKKLIHKFNESPESVMQFLSI